MAFNFNWSPLIADTARARDMLTTALNKSPKPPIIVDDILVTELNLGSIPPELEILEIGDLAEDRFRGIFKMSYTGDAYMTLTTKVQANPLNTYLSAKPTFASPEPLAASSGLTIPLQITLSNIRLSGFVILVFSKQKGITLVFRNDPLESLKVSSTFDSIPFVRDYLQKEIEAQLRELFMGDLPAIIHRLSLRLWSPDHQQKTNSTGEASASGEENGNEQQASNQEPVDPLSSPPQDPFDEFGRPLDDDELSSLDSLAAVKPHASFSQKNLLRLASLKESHATLSLFTPPMRDVVFRAWAGAAERVAGGDGVLSPNSGYNSLTMALLSRNQNGSSTSLASSAYSASETSTSPYASRRTSVAGGLTSIRSSASVSSYHHNNGSNRRNGGRQRKHRVVNLRGSKKDKTSKTVENEVSTENRPTTPSSDCASSSYFPTSISNPEQRQNINHYRSTAREGELETPPASPEYIKKTPTAAARTIDAGNETIRPSRMSRRLHEAVNRSADDEPVQSEQTRQERNRNAGYSQGKSPGKSPSRSRPASYSSSTSNASAANNGISMPGGSILEQAWMLKMATEIARKVAEEQSSSHATASNNISSSGLLQTNTSSHQEVRSGGSGRESPFRDWNSFWQQQTSAGGDIGSGVVGRFNNDSSSTKQRDFKDRHEGEADEEDIPPPPAYAA